MSLKSKFSIFNPKGIIILVVFLAVVDVAVAFGLSPLVTRVVVAAANEHADVKIAIDKIRLHPVLLSITAGDVEIYDPDNPSARMFYGKRMSARLDPWALLSKRVFLSSLTFKGVELEVVKDAQGRFNVEKITQDKEAADAGKLESLQRWWKSGRKDWFSNIYEKLKTLTRRKKEEKEKAAEKKEIRTEVEELHRGKVVRFTSPKQTLFRIKKLKLSGGKVILNERGTRLPPIEDIHLLLKNLIIRPSGAVSMDLVHAEGRISSGREGNFKIHLVQKRDAVDVKVHLKDMDMAVLKPLYEDSLPVSFARGFLALDSRSHFDSESLDSQNHLKIDSYEMTAKHQWNIGGFATKPIVDALNRLPEFEIKFKISGTPDRPSYSGFQESLMEIVKDDLLQEGMMSGIKEKTGQQVEKISEKLKSLF